MGAVKLDRQRVGAGSLSLLPRLTLSPFQRSALVGMKDACELARALPLAGGVCLASVSSERDNEAASLATRRSYTQ